MTPAERTLRLRGRGLDWKVLEDETVVLDLQSSCYLSINRSGTALWPLLAEGATMAQLVAKLTSECGASESDARRDAGAFCASLEAEGLLEG